MPTRYLLIPVADHNARREIETDDPDEMFRLADSLANQTGAGVIIGPPGFGDPWAVLHHTPRAIRRLQPMVPWDPRFGMK